MYISIFLVSAFLLSIKDDKNKFDSFVCFTVLFFLIVFIGTRDSSAGGDFRAYQQKFLTLSQTSWEGFISNVYESTGELLFSFLMKLFASAGFGFYTFYTFIVAIYVFSFYFSINDSDNIYICRFGSYAVFLFFYLLLITNIVRQAVAFSLCLLGIKYVFRNDFKRFAFPIVFACGFHLSALLSLPIWFIWDHRRNRPIRLRPAIIFACVLSLAILYSQQIIGKLMAFFPFLNRYLGYFAENKLGENYEFILRVLELSVVCILHRNLIAKNRKADFYLILGVLTVLCCSLGFFNTYVKRVGYYFQVPFHMFFYSNIPVCFRRRERGFVCLLEFVYVLIQFMISKSAIGYDSILF